MATTPTPDQDAEPGRELSRFCAAACDLNQLNHAAIPHPPWDCNAPDDAPTLGQADRRFLEGLDPDRLPWVRYATPLVLHAGELERLCGPIGSAMHALEVDEIDRDTPEAERFSPRLEAVDHRLIRVSLDAQRASTRLDVPVRVSCADANQLREVLGEAAGRLDDLIRRRDAETPGYLVGSQFYGKAAEGLRGWLNATLERQQHRPAAHTERAMGASLQLTDRDRAHLREEAAHRHRSISEAVRQWPTGRGSRGER
jgi:hypothetical protein